MLRKACAACAALVVSYAQDDSVTILDEGEASVLPSLEHMDIRDFLTVCAPGDVELAFLRCNK